MDDRTDETFGRVLRSTKMMKQPQTPRVMSEHVDFNHHDKDVPIAYSINIEALTTSKRSLVCSISTEPLGVPKQRAVNPLTSAKSTRCLAKKDDGHVKSAGHVRRSSIHLPVTYSTSIHIPCRSSPVKPRPSTISLSQSSRHHYHHYHHHHHHHHHHYEPLPTSTRPSTSIKPKPLTQITSNSSTELTTTDTSPNSLSTPKKSRKNTYSSPPIPPSHALNKQSPHSSSPPLPSYSALLWNWLRPTSSKSPSHHEGGQSEYSEVCRHESPSKRSLLFKFFTSPVEKPNQSKRPHRTCFARPRLHSSSPLPNKRAHYNE